MLELLKLLQVADLVLTMIGNYQIDMVKFNAMRDKARAEGRQLTVAEMQELLADAKIAIDEIGKPIPPPVV